MDSHSKIRNNIDYLHNVAHEMASKEPKPDYGGSSQGIHQMNKTAGKDRAPGIGLATEHRLPEAFKARTDADANLVEITSPSSRPLNVAINSFASVANALAVFAPTGEATMEPGHTIKLVDEFSGREVTVTANTFIDVATALQTFAVSRGKYLPAATVESETVAATSAPAVVSSAPAAKTTSARKPKTTAPTPAAEVAAAVAEAPAVEAPKKQKAAARKAPAAKKAAAKTKKAAKAVSAKGATAKGAASGKAKKTDAPAVITEAVAPETVASTPAAPEPAKAEKPAKPTKAAAKPKKTAAAPKVSEAKVSKPKAAPKAAATKATTSKPAKTKATAPKAAETPAWVGTLPTEHIDDSGSFRIEARTLGLPKEKAKTVSGISDGSQDATSFGYEVLQGGKAGGKHLGWIIAEALDSMIVTGFGEIQPSKHANLSAALIRIRITNLPRLLNA